ncbi:hypothetical protein BH11CYA1_BH11CYA1_22690 [soil metagenome]
MKNRATNIVSATLFLLLANALVGLAADNLFSQAENYYAKKNYIASEKLLRQFLASNQNHAPSLYLLGNIYLIQRHLTEARQCYRACIKSGADTRPGQYAAMALSEIEAADKVKEVDTDESLLEPKALKASSLTSKQEIEKQSILKLQKEMLARNQKDFKIQADKLTSEEDQQIEFAPFNQAEQRNAEYRLVRENALAQIKQDFDGRRKALKEIYDRKENTINQEFKRRLAPFGAN